MGRLSSLKLARRFRKPREGEELPHLEALIEEETATVVDGYHHARWIVPLASLPLALAVFLPLALAVHPNFWIGFAGVLAIGAVCGLVFHELARRISPSQLLLKKRCAALAARMVRFDTLVGLQPVLSPSVGAILDEAARAYMSGRPSSALRFGKQAGIWTEAEAQAQAALEGAMAEMLGLGLPESVEAQEAELNRGWAEPLLDEMKSTSKALVRRKTSSSFASQLDPSHQPLSELSEARARLERLETAASELDEERESEKA